MVFDMDKLTWTCHICKQERPDRFISVYSRPLMDPFNEDRLMGQENIRYCNDNPACKDAATRYSHIRRSETYLDSKPTRQDLPLVVSVGTRVVTWKESLIVLVAVLCVTTVLLWLL